MKHATRANKLPPVSTTGGSFIKTMEGFIKIHRKILEWEWYDDINTFRLFMHLLLTCNFKEAKWRGRIIRSWQKVTSLSHMASETGLSIQQIRSSIKKLKSTGEVTHEATSDYTILTLNNWAIYNTQDNKRITNEQQTSNKRITTIEESKNDKKEKNNTTAKAVAEQAQEFWNKEINDILKALKTSVGCDTFAESEKQQRMYGKHFLNLGKNIGKEEFTNRLKIILQDNFKAKNCNKLAYLYKEIKSFIHSPIIPKKSTVV